MRFPLLRITIVFLLTTRLAMAFDWEDGALHVDFSSEGYYQDVQGNEANSVLEEGWMHREDLIMDLNQELSQNAKFQGYAHIRSSNDPQHQINERSVMFVEGYGRLADDYGADVYEIWGGDYAENSSPYTMNTSLLGAKAFYKPKDWMKISALFGRNRDKSLDGYTRYTTGGKAAFKYKDHLTFGATLLHTEVDESSINEDSPVGDQFNRVFGGDLHLNLLEDTLHFDVAYARSVHNYDKRDNALQDQYDNAVLIKGDINPIKNLIVSATFERVEPWFNSVLGSASPDLQRVLGQLDYSPSQVISSVTLLHEYSFNKLNDHSLEENRTYTHTTAFNAAIAPFYARDDIWNSFNVNLQIDHNKNESRDQPRTLDQDDLSANLTVSQSFDHLDYDLGYTYSKFWDRVDSINEIQSHNPVVSIGSSYPWLFLEWSWNFNCGYEHRKYINSGFVDRIYSADGQLSLFYDKTKSTFSLGAAVEYADNAPDPEFDAPDNRGRLYTATFEQMLSEKEAFSANLTLRLSHMEYDEDTYGEDYRETVYHVSVTMKF